MENESGIGFLPVPVPDGLEAALGYDGEGRYLAAWWEPWGDEAIWSDGRLTATGYGWGFLAYIQHPAVAPALAPYDLGSIENEGGHRLLFDLVERRAYIGEARAVEHFLKENVSRPRLTPEQIEQFKVALRKLQERGPRDIDMVDMTEVVRLVEEQDRAIKALIGQLDAAQISTR